MKLTKTALAAMTVCTFVAGAASAQVTDPAIDLNGDSMYSFPELQTSMPEMTQDEFTALDTSGDGLLDADEIAVGVEAGILPAMDG